MGTIGAEYEIVVRSTDGEVVERFGGESDSFLTNFTKLIEAGVKSVNVSVVDLGGTARSCGNFSCATKDDPGGVTTRGVLVGNGAGTVAASNRSLANQIQNSVLSYQPALGAPEIPYVSDGMIKCRIIKRSFANVSGAPVLITETGIAALASGYNILVLRDLLSELVNVPVGGAVDVAYTFKSPVSGGFTLNYFKALACSFYGGAAIPVIDTGGISRSIDFVGTFPTNALAGQGHFGIQVGTDTAPSTGSEYTLGSPVAHGSDNGQLQYGEMRYNATAVSGSNIEFSCYRSFINLSENPITIREVGLVARHSGYDILLMRNTIDPIEIPPYDGVNVTITHRTVI